METIIKYIKLPFSFSTGAMLAEVQSMTDVWLSHYNKNDYTGDWKAIPLRSVGGSTTQAFAIPSGAAAYSDTLFMQSCPEIQKAIDSFLCQKTAVRILNLRPGAVVKEHKDPGLCFEQGEIRLHIPLQTNDKVIFFTEDEPLTMQRGECWYVNFDLNHHLANHGDTDRIHLVIDCVVNEWVKDLFNTCDDENMKRIPVPEQFSAEDKQRIIEQLRSLGTDTAAKLADNMAQTLTDK